MPASASLWMSLRLTLRPLAAVKALSYRPSSPRSMTFLISYSETENISGAGEPAPTITTKDRLALVTVIVKGTPYVIVDICLRMLKPSELYKAQGFPPTMSLPKVPMANRSLKPSRFTCVATASGRSRWPHLLEQTPLGKYFMMSI